MKIINITPHSILSSLLSCVLIFNTVVPAFSQVKKNNFSKQKFNFSALSKDIDTQVTSSLQVASNLHLDNQAFKASNGFLSEVQLARLEQIKTIFTPIQLESSKQNISDYDLFKQNYTKQINEEFKREEASLNASRNKLLTTIDKNTAKYRQEVYKPLIHDVVTDEVSSHNPDNAPDVSQLINTINEDIKSLSYNPNQSLEEQIGALAGKYKNDPLTAKLIRSVARKAQTDKSNTFLIREQAVIQWRQQALDSADQWYTQNVASLNAWKKDATQQTKQVFETEYEPKALKERETVVQNAIRDLWAYKDKAPRARLLLLNKTPIIAQLRTLDGESFLTQEQKDWINNQNIRLLTDSKCGTENLGANACSSELIAMVSLGMLTNSREAAYAIDQFMTSRLQSAYAVPILLTGTTALLSMKQYSTLEGFIASATAKEREIKNIDILSVRTIVDALANINGQYLGEISKYAQYPLQKDATSQTALANAWEDVAQLLADEGSTQALEILRKYGIEKCYAYTKTTTSLSTTSHIGCTGIIPFLVGALASGKSGAEQYKLTTVDATPGYIATNNGTQYISAQQAKTNAANYAAKTQQFHQHAANMGLTNAAAVARHLFLQSMGDLSAESELRVDTKLFQAYNNAMKNKTPKAGAEIKAYTRNSEIYNAKQARQERTQIFRKIGFWSDIAILLYCLVDLTKWANAGVKITRAISKASRMARQGATVAQRASMLRSLNITSQLRSVVSIPSKMKNAMAPAVLAELPHFTSQTVQLPKFAGFVESAGVLSAKALQVSAETGTLAVDISSLTSVAQGSVSPEKVKTLNTVLANAATEANTQFANRSAWKRFFTFDQNQAYRSYLTREFTKAAEPTKLSLSDINPIRYRLQYGNISVPQNISAFQVPNLIVSSQGMPALNLPALTRVMSASLARTPSQQEVVATQTLLNNALENATSQFLNRNWLSRQWGFLRGNYNTTYKNLLLDNIAAQFDKEGKIFTNPLEYRLYRDIVQTITADKNLHVPSWMTQFNHFHGTKSSGMFHSMGSVLFQVEGSANTPVSLPLAFQMQRKGFMSSGISGVSKGGYQRVIITEQGDGSFVFGIGNNLSSPIKPSQFKLTIDSQDIPAILRASQTYTGEPLQLKLTSTGGKWLWNTDFYSKRLTAFKQARLDGKFFPIGTFLRGKNNVYVHEIPVQIRLADGTLQKLPVVFKSDSYLGLRQASAIFEQNQLNWYQNGQRLSHVPQLAFSLPKNQIHPFLDLVRNAQIPSYLHISGIAGKNKLTPLMWATGLSLSSASTGLIAPLENVYGNNITEGEKTMISLAFPYLPSLAAPLFSPLVMKIGALRTLQLALGFSTAGLFFTAANGFSGKLDDNNLPPIWPLYVSGVAIGISSALSRSGLNLLIDSMGGGGTLLKSMAYKNIGSFALLLPPFIANYIDKDIDFSLAFPVLGTLSAGALTWVSTSRINTNIGKVSGFMPFKSFEKARPLSWLPTLGNNVWTAGKSTWEESWSTVRLLMTKEVLPLTLAATAFTGFEAGAFSKAGNQMIRPNLQEKELPSWVPETNRNNYVSMLTNLSVISFPLLARFAAKPTLKLLETGRAGDEYRRMLQASFALNATGASLLYANGFNGYGSLGMLGIGLMGFGTANMTQSFQKLSNISVKTSSYAQKLTRGLSGTLKADMEKSLVTKTMTGFPVQQLGIAIVPTIVSSYTDRQIDEGTIQKGEAALSSMWIPVTSLALCFGLSASRIGLFPTNLPNGIAAFSRGIIGSYPGALQQIQKPTSYLTQPIFGVPTGFQPIPTQSIIHMNKIIPSQKVLENMEKKAESAKK